MKQLEITEILGGDEVMIYEELFDDDAVITNEGNFMRIADDKQCVLINTAGKELIALMPAELEDDSLCNSHCKCHDDQADAGQFDCQGACKNRCYDCANQDRISKGEGNDSK